MNTLRVMSYNIKIGGAPNQSQRAQQLADEVTANAGGPDVLAVQESNKNSVTNFGSKLAPKGYSYVQPNFAPYPKKFNLGIVDDDPGLPALLYRSSRFSSVSGFSRNLYQGANAPSQCSTDANGNLKIKGRVGIFNVVANSPVREYVIANVHLTGSCAAAREIEVERLRSVLTNVMQDKPNGKLVVLGDFNSKQATGPAKVLADTIHAGGRSINLAPVGFSRGTFNPDWPAAQTTPAAAGGPDQVWYQKVFKATNEVVQYRNAANQPSDHFAVRVDLSEAAAKVQRHSGGEFSDSDSDGNGDLVTMSNSGAMTLHAGNWSLTSPFSNRGVYGIGSGWRNSVLLNAGEVDRGGAGDLLALVRGSSGGSVNPS